MKKTIGTILILMVLLFGFNNCEPLSEGGTTVGSEKLSVNFADYDSAPNPNIGPIKDIRMCVYKIKLWYTELYEPVVPDGTLIHDPQKKFISYPIRREVRILPDGTLIGHIPLFAGRYSQVEIYSQAADYSGDTNANCSFRRTPLYVENSYGILDDADTIYFALGYHLNSEIKPETGIIIPFQPMATVLQRLTSNADLKDFIYNGADETRWVYYWPQNYTD
jgi:hypothetical protein